MAKVHGYTDEVTVCDCCGKKNLKGTFVVENEAGDLLNYGSVCVNKVYGKARGDAIKFEAKAIAAVKSLSWDSVVDKYSRGIFPNFIAAIKENGKMPGTNSNAEMAAVVAFKHYKTGEILRQKEAR